MKALTDRLFGWHGPSVAALASQLTDIGDGLSAAMSELSRDPEPSRCEMMAIQLEGALRHCRQLAEAARRELSPEPPRAA